MDNNKKKFYKNAAILGVAGIIVKIIGAVYRIPVTNIIMDTGIGYYQTVYPVYQILLTISTAGIPVAIAKLVSENMALGRARAAKRVLDLSLKLMFSIGFISAVLVYIFGHQIVKFLGNDNSYYSLMALIPALLFAPLMSSFRGFYQGRENMVPTAVSQVIEQFSKLITGLYLTYALLPYGLPVAAGAAQSGGSFGAVFGFAFLMIVFLKDKKDFKKQVDGDETGFKYDDRQLLKQIIAIAIPITIGASINPIMDFIDTKLVYMRLADIGYSKELANDMFGWLKGMAQTLINLPQALSIAMSMSLVPLVSRALIKRDIDSMNKTIESGIRFTLLFSMPCAFGFISLSYPIVQFLYYKNPSKTIAGTAELLTILSLGVIFLTLIQVLTAILQGVGRPELPVKNLVAGSVVKVVLTYILTGIPVINIKGAAISTIIAYIIAFSLNYYELKKIINFKYNFKIFSIKLLAICIFMACAASFSYKIFAKISGNLTATFCSICLAGLIYVLMIFMFKLISIEEILKKRK